MIYDTFMFYNEMELLEIRLHELTSVVDCFVLVEATRTHSNRPKPLYFEENRARFAAFNSKIIHVVVEDTPETANAWTIERYQRDCITRGLASCRPDDVILMSDVDEIPRAASVTAAVQALRYDSSPRAELWHRLLKTRAAARRLRAIFKKRHPFVHVFALTPYIYYLNCVSSRRFFPATRMVHFRDLAVPHELRRWHGTLIADAGWHFTCMGGIDSILDKMASFAHQEYNRPEYMDRERIAALMSRGEYIFSASGGTDEFRFVDIDSTYPAYVVNHLDRFDAWIKK